MGYTHYWRTSQEISPGTWEKICTRVIAAREYLEAPLGQWEITKDDICLNGEGEDGHETFYFTRVGDGFGFCKTARKKYDKLVVAALLLIEFTTEGSIRISSDGDPDDLTLGRMIASQVVLDELDGLLNSMGGADE